MPGPISESYRGPGDYRDIPVAEATRLARDYAKDVILVIAIDDAFSRFHFTTYGVRPEAKVRAARLADAFAKFLSCNPADTVTYADFRRAEEAARDRADKEALLAACKAMLASPKRGNEPSEEAVEMARKAIAQAEAKRGGEEG